MPDRQLSGEIKRKLKQQTPPLEGAIMLTVLSVIFENHRRGKTMLPGG